MVLVIRMARELADMIADDTSRLNVLQTITLLFDVYCSGRASLDQILNDLKDIAFTVLSVSKPDIPVDDRRKMAEEMAEKLMNAFKLEGMLRRAVSLYTSMFRH